MDSRKSISCESSLVLPTNMGSAKVEAFNFSQARSLNQVSSVLLKSFTYYQSKATDLKNG
jgi:hypothetical protein